jgi:hypothetical protein
MVVDNINATQLDSFIFPGFGVWAEYWLFVPLPQGCDMLSWSPIRYPGLLLGKEEETQSTRKQPPQIHLCLLLKAWGERWSLWVKGCVLIPSWVTLKSAPPLLTWVRVTLTKPYPCVDLAAFSCYQAAVFPEPVQVGSSGVVTEQPQKVTDLLCQSSPEPWYMAPQERGFTLCQWWPSEMSRGR